MNSGLKVSNTKPTKTWDELGIKGEQYETIAHLTPEFIPGFSGFRIAHV
jgi:hypothetical protein